MQQTVSSSSQPFSALTPDGIVAAAEFYSGMRFDGMITPYNSYVNRVFGLTSEAETDYIIKFYRAGRWSAAAVTDEHLFLSDCAALEVPVAVPLTAARAPSPQTAGGFTQITPTLAQTPDGLLYTLFPRVRARTFDIYSDDDWIRTGRALGRLHTAARRRQAPARLQCTPQQTTEPYIRYLLKEKLVTPELTGVLTGICDEALDYIEDLYERLLGPCGTDGRFHTPLFQRIHGDCHRGNILEQFVSPSPARPSDSAPDNAAAADTAAGEQSVITLLDFDDMMNGPAIQDLWLLLPGYRRDSMRELNLLLEGYDEFSPAEPLYRETCLIEPLRFMRNVYFLAWTAIQHNDAGFEQRNPGWGTKAFWEKEIEDLQTQLAVIKEEYDALQNAAPDYN